MDEHPKQTEGASHPEQTRFVVLVDTAEEQWHGRLLIESLRAFGGRLGDCPVWVFTPDDHAIAGAYHDMSGVQCLPLHIGDELDHYFLANKVCACARAEEMASSEVRSLVWLSPYALVLQPPLLFDLAPSLDAALPPVHIRNVGSPADEPLDGFWREVYASVGLEEAAFTVECSVDAQRLRPYFNTHVFSIDPSKRLLQEWRERFRALVADRAFQTRHCADELYRIFLHQAVLSTLLARRLQSERLRLLPKEYSYPLHLHSRVPENRRPASLNALVCPVYEEAFRYPETLNGLEVHEPLRSWLVEHAPGGVQHL